MEIVHEAHYPLRFRRCQNVGYVKLYWEGSATVVLDHIEIMTPFRRQGAGQGVLKKLIELVGAAGAQEMTGWIQPPDDSPSFDDLVVFYRSVGFHVIGDRLYLRLAAPRVSKV